MHDRFESLRRSHGNDATATANGRLESKEKQGVWLKAQMRVFMRDF